MRLLRMECMDYVHEPLAYLYSVAASAVADFMLAERRHQRVVSNNDLVDSWDENLNQFSPDDIAERISVEQELERALNQLPHAQAAALIYHYQDGLSCDETAKKLGLSTKSVDKYLARAKARMRTILAEGNTGVGNSWSQSEPLLQKSGTIVDATARETPPSTKPATRR